MKIATAVAIAANTRATKMTQISGPARTAREPTELVEQPEWVHRACRERASARRGHDKEALNGTRSKPIADRRRRHPRLGPAERHRRDQRGRYRRDPHDRRGRRPDSLDAVLVELGRSRLRHRPTSRDVRRGP